MILLLLAANLGLGCSVREVGPSAAASDTIYIVERGDTLEEIGARFALPARELQEYNTIVDPHRLQVGQRIRIPALGPLRTSAADRSPVALTLRPAEISDSVDGAPLRRISIAPAKHYLGALVMPLAGARHSSQFGWRWSKFHEGIDLSAPEGTRIVAAHRGEVVFTSESYFGYGKIVVIRGEGLMTVYGHNSRNRVSRGDFVEAGEWIADVGQTGDASGPHLHFETRVQEPHGRFAAVDPAIFFRSR
jgi:murein DD-endopeptidase MepM/ murein hydrolase activator NlpD